MKTLAHVLFLSLSMGLLACGGGSGGHRAVGEQDTELEETHQDLAEAEVDASAEVVEPNRSDEVFAPDHIAQVDITLSEADWATLRNQGRDIMDIIGPGCLDGHVPSPFTNFMATVTIDGEGIPEVAVRKKGFLGSLSTSKPSLRLKFDEYVEGQGYMGMERMTLNNSLQDPSYVRQCLAYGVFAAAGVPAPRCNFADVTVNGEHLGLFVHVETVKKRFLRRYFEDDEGKLYEGTLSDFRQGWVNTFGLGTNKNQVDDRRELNALVRALEVQEVDLLEAIEPLVDVDAFLTFWAVESLVAHWDGYAGNTNNFFVYSDPTDGGRFRFLPWGVDGTFRPPEDRPDQALLATGVLARRLYLEPATQARYVARMRELLDTVWVEDTLFAEVARMEALVVPLLGEAERVDVLASIAEVRGFLSSQRGRVEAELASPPLWEVPLREAPCVRDVGSVVATFHTTWGSLGGDPFVSGGGEIAAVFHGLVPEFQAIGAQAGAGVEGEQIGRGVVVVVGLTADNVVIVATIDSPLELLQQGTTIAIDWSEVVGNLGVYDPVAQTYQALGLLGEGTLELTQMTTAPDGVVEGRLEATIFEFGF